MRILRHPVRRHVLTALADGDPTDGEDGVGVTPQRLGLEIYRTEVYHWHLPKLADAEFVDWDPATNTIEPGPRFDEIRPVLDRLDGP